MALHLIIDGYNLLAAIRRFALEKRASSETERELLLGELAVYSRQKGHAVTVVFDGWQQGQLIEGREHRMGLQVIYSKRGERADQVIQRLAREYGTDCAIVSSDREIIHHAGGCGAFVLGAPEFAAKLEAVGHGGNTVTYKELDPGEDAPSKRGRHKKGNPRKLPKTQRLRNRQLKRF
ncbi:NYN domain-containing protein [Petrachloros mirabilis]